MSLLSKSVIASSGDNRLPERILFSIFLRDMLINYNLKWGLIGYYGF
jgi:hypothetical protein